MTEAQQRMVERSAARRRPRDAAIVAMLLHAGARVEECARLDVADVAITARTGLVRLHGKGDEVREVPLSAAVRERVSAWMRIRGPKPGPLWTGQRGPMTKAGITEVVLRTGWDAGLPFDLRPHQLWHTFATRWRQGGVDPAVIQRLIGHTSPATTAPVLPSRHAGDRGDDGTHLRRIGIRAPVP